MEQIAFESKLGYIALAVSDRALLALSFGHSTERSALRALQKTLDGCPQPVDTDDTSVLDVDEMIKRLQEFAQGEMTDFSDLEVETFGATSFQRHVIDVCRAIPWGETLSYGEVARRAGRPGAARAVGTVMSSNRVPLVIPCHRVIAANGKLGGYSARQGLAMKRRLLAAEQELAAV